MNRNRKFFDLQLFAGEGSSITSTALLKYQ